MIDIHNSNKKIKQYTLRYYILCEILMLIKLFKNIILILDYQNIMADNLETPTEYKYL